MNACGGKKGKETVRLAPRRESASKYSFFRHISLTQLLLRCWSSFRRLSSIHTHPLFVVLFSLELQFPLTKVMIIKQIYFQLGFSWEHQTHMSFACLFDSNITRIGSDLTELGFNASFSLSYSPLLPPQSLLKPKCFSSFYFTPSLLLTF